MNEQRLFETVPAVGALLAWAAALWLLAGLASDLVSAQPVPGSKGSGEELSSSPAIETALALSESTSFFHYMGNFNPPMRPVRVVRRARRRSRPKSSFVRHELRLKGIMISGKPLAILENERGETFIRGIGEMVESQRIQSISSSKVTIKDSLGTYELTVPEQ